MNQDTTIRESESASSKPASETESLDTSSASATESAMRSADGSAFPRGALAGESENSRTSTGGNPEFGGRTSTAKAVSDCGDLRSEPGSSSLSAHSDNTLALSSVRKSVHSGRDRPKSEDDDSECDLSSAKQCLGENYINRLTDDCLLHIFSFLNFSSLRKCSRVCRRWKEMFRIYSIVHSLDAVYWTLTPRELGKMRTAFYSAGITEIRLRSIQQNFYKTLKKLLRQTNNLKKLVFWGAKLSDCIRVYFSGPWFNISCIPKNLVHLCLRDCKFDTLLFFLDDPNKHLPNLRCLDVGRTETAYERYLLTYFKLTSLRSLYLGNCFNTYCSMDIFADMFTWYYVNQLIYLQVLDLEKFPVHDVSVTYIINYCLNLKQLFLCSTNVTDECLQNVTRKNTALNYLCVNATEISLYAIKQFLRNSCEHNKITVLCFDESPEIDHFSDCDPNWNIIVCRGYSTSDCCHIYSHVCL